MEISAIMCVHRIKNYHIVATLDPHQPRKRLFFHEVTECKIKEEEHIGWHMGGRPNNHHYSKGVASLGRGGEASSRHSAGGLFLLRSASDTFTRSPCDPRVRCHRCCRSHPREQMSTVTPFKNSNYTRGLITWAASAVKEQSQDLIINRIWLR